MKKIVFYMDESGHFGDPQDEILLVGVLLSNKSRFRAEWRYALQSIFPEFSAGRLLWPHANRFNIPFFHVLAYALVPDESKDVMSWRDMPHHACQRAIELLNDEEKHEFEHLLQEMREGRDPNYNVLKKLNQTSQRDSVVRRELTVICRKRRTLLLSFVQEVCKGTGCALFVCGEDVRGGLGRLGDHSHQAPYLSMQSLTHERLARVLLEEEGEYEISCFIAERPVHDHSLGTTTSLHHRHVTACLDESAAWLEGSGFCTVERPGRILRRDARSLRWSRTTIDEYHQLPVFIVLADVASNQLRRIMLRNHAPTLRKLRSEVEGMGFRCCQLRTGLSYLLSGHDSATLVRSGSHKQNLRSAANSGGWRVWALEQAETFS